MADKTIGQLPVSAGLDDNSLLVTEQGGEARSITGALVKQFAKDAVAEDVSRAEQAAKDASEAKTSVDTAKTAIDQAKTDIDQTKAAIDGIKTDIDTAKTAIDQAQTDVAKNKTDAEAAAQSAGTSATIAAENAGRVAAALNEADGIVEEVTGLRDESMNTVKSSVLFTEQQLTDEQKSQARENIGAVSADEVAQTDYEKNDETSPAYLKNRPFFDKGPSGTVKWNGATSNLVSFTVNESAELNYAGETYYLMPRTSSKVPSAASLEALGGSYTYQTGRDHMDKELGMVVPAVATVAFGAGNGNLDSDSYPGATIVGDMVIVVHEIDTPLYDITVEKPGVYFRKYWQSPNFYQTQVTEMTLTGGTLDDGLERLPMKFLPEGVATEKYVDEAVAKGGGSGDGSSPDAVKYTVQVLTEEQQEQARQNISAPGKVVPDGGELFNAAKDASGEGSHAEGQSTTASGYGAHAEGLYTTAAGDAAHAEGNQTKAPGGAAHAEGSSTEASGQSAHSEGSNTLASGKMAHAEGGYAKALGDASHAEGYYTHAAGMFQHVQGKYNEKDTDGKYAHIVGNGTSNSKRSNAHTLDWDGNAWFKGKVLLGGTSQDDADEAATKQYVDEKATWENLQGKPTIFEGGDTLTWDGDTTGLVSIDVFGTVYYKISSSAPSMDNFSNGVTVNLSAGNSNTYSADGVMPFFDGVISTEAMEFFVILENAVGVDNDGIVFQEAGVYLMHAGPGAYTESLTIPGYTGFGKEVIDPDYLPDSVKGGSGGVVYVNFTTTDGNNYTSDKTFAEVDALISAGQMVIGTVLVDGMFLTYLPVSCYITGQIIMFGAVTTFTGPVVEQIEFDLEGGVVYTRTFLAAPTS